MSEMSDRRSMHNVLNMMYGTYADVLFVLLPFIVLGLQRVWHDQSMLILMGPDLSIAASILGGMAIGKFVLGLITDRNLGRYKERIVFFIAVTLVVVMAPAILLLLLISASVEVPEVVAFVQPILLIIAISLYTTAVSVSNILTRPLLEEEGSERQENSGSGDDEEGNHRELVLPHREGQ